MASVESVMIRSQAGLLIGTQDHRHRLVLQRQRSRCGERHEGVTCGHPRDHLHVTCLRVLVLVRTSFQTTTMVRIHIVRLADQTNLVV